MTGVRRCDPPAVTPQTVAKVSDALVPVLGWRDVPVEQEVIQEMTVLERFVLEMALALGGITAEDFDEVLSLPQEVLAAGASRLVAGRALRSVDDGYDVEPEIATKALAEQGIRRRIPATADFVLLPRTGDLLALPPAKKSWLRQLELARMSPACTAPVPPVLWDERRSGYLAARVLAGDITLLDTEMVDVPVPKDDPPLVGGNKTARLCPAYTCRADVIRDDREQYVVRAVLDGRSQRLKTSVEVPVEFTGADKLVAEWLALTEVMQTPAVQQDAWRAICPESSELPFRGAHRRGPVEWEFRVGEDASLAISSERRRLDEPVGLALESGEATVLLIGWLVPDDDGARVLFGRDRDLGRLLSSADPATEIVAEPNALRDRAWGLRYYRLAYALRESEDFAYD